MVTIATGATLLRVALVVVSIAAMAAGVVLGVHVVSRLVDHYRSGAEGMPDLGWLDHVAARIHARVDGDPRPPAWRPEQCSPAGRGERPRDLPPVTTIAAYILQRPEAAEWPADEIEAAIQVDAIFQSARGSNGGA